MNCHYIKDRGVKVLIPGCWSVVISGDKRDCTCKFDKSKSIEERVLKLEDEIQQLKKAIKKLNEV